MYCPHCSHLNLPGSDQCARCLFDLASIDRPMPQDKIDASLMTDSVQTLGPRPPVTVPTTATLGEALVRMIDRGVGALLITDDRNQLAGIITERDFLDKVAGRDGFEQLAAAEFMARDPESVRATDTLAFALRKMSDGGFRHLPVVDDGRPTGVVSVRDLLRHVTRLGTA